MPSVRLAAVVFTCAVVAFTVAFLAGRAGRPETTRAIAAPDLPKLPAAVTTAVLPRPAVVAPLPALRVPHAASNRKRTPPASSSSGGQTTTAPVTSSGATGSTGSAGTTASTGSQSSSGTAKAQSKPRPSPQRKPTPSDSSSSDTGDILGG